MNGPGICPQCGRDVTYYEWNNGHVCNVRDINAHEARQAEAARHAERERERQEFIDRAVIAMVPSYDWPLARDCLSYNAAPLLEKAETLWLEREERRVARLERKESDAAG